MEFIHTFGKRPLPLIAACSGRPLVASLITFSLWCWLRMAMRGLSSGPRPRSKGRTHFPVCNCKRRRMLFLMVAHYKHAERAREHQHTMRSANAHPTLHQPLAILWQCGYLGLNGKRTNVRSFAS